MSLAFQLRKPRSRSGTGTTTRRCASAAVPPRLRTCVRRSTFGCDGPTRSVLLGRSSCSSEGSPVMAGSAPILEDSSDSVADGHRRIAADGIASDVSSISASGSCSANSSTVLRSKLRESYHQSSCTRSAARYARSSRAWRRPGSVPSVGEEDLGRRFCRELRRTRSGGQTCGAQRRASPSRLQSLRIVHLSGTDPLCPATSTGTTPSPMVRAIVRPKAARRISSVARRDTTARRPAPLSACSLSGADSFAKSSVWGGSAVS